MHLLLYSELLGQLNAHQLNLRTISEYEGIHARLPILQDEMTAWLSTGPSFSILVLPIAGFAEEPYIKARPNRNIDNARMFPRCGVTLNHPWPCVRLIYC